MEGSKNHFFVTFTSIFFYIVYFLKTEHKIAPFSAFLRCWRTFSIFPQNDSISNILIFCCIWQLVTAEEFHKYLERGLTTAESQAANSFHCKTPDCPGFCFFDDDNNFFQCPVCNKQNCLTCKAIHEGMNCKQYQDDLKRRATNDDAARKTQEALEVGH